MSNSIQSLLSERFAAALTAIGAPADASPHVRAAGDPKFGDYQCNAAMPLAKPLGAKPRDIAQCLVDAVDLEGIAAPLEIAGPGFINIRLLPSFLANWLEAVPAPPVTSSADAPASTTSNRVADAAAAALAEITTPVPADRLNLAAPQNAGRVVVDYSCPNIAKQMHVGHLRSTIIGDVFARLLALEGCDVIRQNHIGDWGTQFGMLIRFYQEQPLPTFETHADVLAAAVADYRAAQTRFQEDAAFADESRAWVGKLQQGDSEARRIWHALVDLSRAAFGDIYHRLGVLLTDADVRGESAYNDQLPAVVAELREKLAPGANPRAVCRPDQDAVCIFLYDEQGQPQFKNPDGEPLPMIIQKSDGAFLYATTDLAALRYRTVELSAKRLVYVTDARQQLHFQMLFATARAVGWATDDVRLDHVWFGTVLGADKKPLKTRAGDTVLLKDLLDEAENRALGVLQAREQESQDQESRAGTQDSTRDQTADSAVARAVGVGAVKYADLCRERTGDYVFDWDNMLAFTGNTAPYMLYAYARIRSIYRKAAAELDADMNAVYAAPLQLDHDAERTLALRLGRFRETLDVVSSDLMPHALCQYLFDTAQEFSRFYENCPVLTADDPSLRVSRLRLCDLTARTLRLGLHLLGIATIERM